jgi:predicted O-methyltransferase YrrM
MGLELDFLHGISLKVGSLGELVEIGTNIGQSAIALAHAQKQQGGRPIHTIDLYENKDSATNFDATGVSSHIIRIVQESSSAASGWSRPIEFLWIDGDHSYQGVAADIRAWSRFVVPGGFIGFHDCPGVGETIEVWQAIHEELLSRPRVWRMISDRADGSLILLLQRLQAEPAGEGASQTPSSGLYWFYRNVRSAFFLAFPRLSRAAVGLTMKLKSLFDAPPRR